MNGHDNSEVAQRILVFQQNASALSKIAGIRKYGGTSLALTIVSIDEALPAVIDDAAEYLPPVLPASLVLDYLKHPDLSDELARLCSLQGIPLIASGKKTRWPGVFTPPT